MEIKRIKIRTGYYFWFDKPSYKFKLWLFNTHDYPYAHHHGRKAFEVTLLGFKIGWSKPLQKPVLNH